MMFKTITDEATGSTKVVNSLFEQIKKIKEVGLKGWLNTSDIDLDLINDYNKSIETSTDKQATMAEYISNTNKATADLIKSTNGAVVSEKAKTAALNASTVAAKASALATKALRVALSTLASIGISLAINGIITLITKLVNAEQEAKQQAVENAKAYENQKESLDELKAKYIEIMDSTDDEAEKTKKLASIKDTLFEKYDIEKEKIDAINESREKGLELFDKEAKKNAEKYINDNAEEYQKAVNGVYSHFYDIAIWHGDFAKTYSFDELKEDFNDASKELKNFGMELTNVSKSGYKKFQIDFGDDAYESYDMIQDALSYYNDLIRRGKELNSIQQSIYDQLNASKDSLYKRLFDSETGYDKILTTYAEALWTKYETEFIQNGHKAFSEINNSEELDNWKQEFLKSIEGTLSDTNWWEYLDNLFADKLNQISKSGGGAVGSIPISLDLTDFNKSLDETKEKLETLITTASKVKSALKSAFSKDTFSVEDVLELTELMPNLSDKFTMNEDGTFSIDYDDLRAGAEEYIKTQQNELDKTNELIQAKIDELEANIALNKSKMESARINGDYKSVEVINDIINTDKDSVDELKSKLDNNKIYSQYLSNAAKDLFTSFSDVIEILTDRSNVISDVENSITENGTITLEVLNKIKDVYPELENDVANYLMGLIDEQSLLSKLNKAYDDSLYKYRFAVAQKVKLTDEELQSYLDVLNTKYAADENYYANLGALGENFINYMKDNYDIDLQNCKTWNDAKLKMQQETMAKLTALAGGINIKDYYDFETGKKIGNWSDLYSNAGLVNSGVLSQLVNILSDYGDGIQEFGKLFKSADAINGATGKSPSSAKDTTSSFFDWIQVKLEKLKTITSNFIDSITDTISKKQSETYLNKAIKSVRNEKIANQKAIETYTAEANKIGLSDEWKRKIQNGDYSLDEVKDPDLAKKIQDYQELWDKIKGCKQNVKDLTKAEQEYITQREDLNIDAYEYDVGRKQYRRNQYENVITRKNLEGKKVTAQDYKRTNAAIERENKSLMESIAYKTQIQSQYDPTSKRYQELQESIDADKQSIEDNTNAILGNTQKMSEIKIEDIQRKADSYGRKVQIKQNQIDLREAQGYKVGASAYQYMIDYTEAENETLRKQRDEIKKLQAETEVGSEKWNEYQDQLEGINDTIYSNRIQQAEWNAQIRDMPIDKLQSYLDLMDSIKATVKSEVEMMEYIYGESSITANDILKQQYSQKDLDTQWDIVNKANKLYADAKRDGRAEDMEKYQKMANEAEQSYYDMLKTNEELFRRARDITLYRGYEQDLQHIEDIKKALNSLEDMLNDDALFNDDGSFSNQGIAKVALTVNQLEQARASAANYQKQIDELYANYDKYNSEDEFNEKVRELTDGYQSATAEVNQYTEAIKDLYKNQAQEELNVLNELIDARSEALEKKKSYYDYDRTIRNKTKDITAMQMQIEALNGVSTAEAKAQKALLQEQLNGLEEDLADTQAEHIYQVQIDGLNEQKEILQDIYDTFIDSLNKCLDTEQEIISSATYLAVNSVQTVQSLLYDIAKARGYAIDPVYMSNNNTLPHFANGGLVESKGKDDGLAWLKAGEYVLNENAFKAFKYTLPIIDNLADKMHTMIKSMDSAEKPVSIGDVQLIVQGNVDKDVMTDLKKYQKQITDSVITSITKDLIKVGYKR